VLSIEHRQKEKDKVKRYMSKQALEDVERREAYKKRVEDMERLSWAVNLIQVGKVYYIYRSYKLKGERGKERG
jgi:hypothetical protein